jgi:hypothetical protein
MKMIVAILLLGMTGPAIAETGKPAEQPITVYKGGKPYIYDGLRRMAPRCQMQDGSEICSAVPEIDKPKAEKKPAPKGVG